MKAVAFSLLVTVGACGVEKPTICTPTRVDLNVQLLCATTSDPVDNYGDPSDGIYLDEIDGVQVLVVPSCDRCSPVGVSQ